MKIGTRICHIYNPKKHGVVVSERNDQLQILWDGESSPMFHPASMIVSIEVAAAFPDAIEPEPADEPEAEDDSGVSPLSLEIVTEVEDEVDEDAETTADPEDVIEPEVIGE
jgi:hypothetical protein